MFDLENIVRPNIKALAPYATARHEYEGEAKIFLDANENAFGSPVTSENDEGVPFGYNRYPDPMQQKLKEKISSIKGLPTQNVFIGNGSDVAIDVLQRIFCEPGMDNIIICPPTYGMYKVCADINNIKINEVPLLANYQLDLIGIEAAINANTKMIFICSPNNPTGNSMYCDDVEMVINNFDGLVVIDEAYINYSQQKTFIPTLTEYANVVILQTLSKAWGLAGLRVGMAFGSAQLISYMNKVKYPYNINEATQQLAIAALDNIATVNEWTKQTIIERSELEKHLAAQYFCKKITPSDANFLLVEFDNAGDLYKFLCTQGSIVRDRSRVILCENCLRITIGTTEENIILVQQIRSFYK